VVEVDEGADQGTDQFGGQGAENEPLSDNEEEEDGEEEENDDDEEEGDGGGGQTEEDKEDNDDKLEELEELLNGREQRKKEEEARKKAVAEREREKRQDAKAKWDAASGLSNPALKLAPSEWGIRTGKGDRKRTDMVDRVCDVACLVLLLGDRQSKRALEESAGQQCRPEMRRIIVYVPSKHSP